MERIMCKIWWKSSANKQKGIHGWVGRGWARGRWKEGLDILIYESSTLLFWVSRGRDQFNILIVWLVGFLKLTTILKVAFYWLKCVATTKHHLAQYFRGSGTSQKECSSSRGLRSGHKHSKESLAFEWERPICSYETRIVQQQNG